MDPKRKSRLDQDLDQIVSLIKSRLGSKKLNAIILYGSYGRDEGAFYSLDDGSLEPYNDYDIVVVMDNPMEPALLNSIARDLKDKLSIRWIDISQKTPRELESLKPSVFNFDLKNGSKVIFGNNGILDKIPDFKASDLPLIEAEVLFFTRLWCFCGCLRADWRSVPTTDEERRFFRNQMAKAILAVGDVLLLSKGEYHSSYVARVQKLTRYYADQPDLVELFEWALDEKLTPKADKMELVEIEVLYKRVAVLFYDKMLQVMSQKYARQFDAVKQYYKTLKQTRENLILVLKTTLKKRRFQATAFKPIDWAQAYILEVYLFGEERSSLKNVSEILRKYRSGSDVNTPRTWDQMRIEVAEIKLGGAW